MKATPQGQGSIALLMHLRWISALVVVLSHVKQGLIATTDYVPHVITTSNTLVKKDILRPDGYGHAAVVVFFVLSGFLVGGKLIELLGTEKLQTDWPRFLIDRFVRIFIVLWPTVLLTAIICSALVYFLPNAPFVASGGWSYALSAPINGDISISKWTSIIFLLNELVAPTLTSNSPLWSLSYEWCYYMIALGAVLAYRKYFSAGSIPVIAYGATLFLLAAHNQPDILFAGISWLAGVFARWAYNHDVVRGHTLRVAGVAIVLGVLAVDHKHPLPDPVLGAALALMIAHHDWKKMTFGNKIGERLASFSYSLYLVHFPILLAIMGVLYAGGRLPQPLRLDVDSLVVAGSTMVFLLLCARAFAWATEDQTVVVRRAILDFIGSRRSFPQAIAVESKAGAAKK